MCKEVLGPPCSQVAALSTVWQQALVSLLSGDSEPETLRTYSSQGQFRALQRLHSDEERATVSIPIREARITHSLSDTQAGENSSLGKLT